MHSDNETEIIKPITKNEKITESAGLNWYSIYFKFCIVYKLWTDNAECPFAGTSET